jgi:hypothetical protein
MSYTKLFASIVTSTIWTEDDKTRIVWITMLALANKHGEVQASIPGLARVAGVSVESCAAAIEKFLSPDPYSRTPDDEGRRIENIEGGWALLNHGKYREMASKDEAREAEAKRKRRYRAKLERNQKDETSQNVRDMSHDVPEKRHIAEADTDTKADTKAKGGGDPKESTPPPLDFPQPKEEPFNPNRIAKFEDVMKMARNQMPPISDECAEAFFDRMEADGWINNQGHPLADWRPRFRLWATAWAKNANSPNRKQP